MSGESHPTFLSILNLNFPATEYVGNMRIVVGSQLVLKSEAGKANKRSLVGYPSKHPRITMLSPALILWLIAGLHVFSSVEGDPLIEVFRWKQMDFYNRGDGYSGGHGYGQGHRPDRPTISGEPLYTDQSICSITP